MRAKIGVAGAGLIFLGAISESWFLAFIGIILIAVSVLYGSETDIPDAVPRPVRLLLPGSFQVRLISSGSKKIHVIKTLRQFTTLGLKEAKDLVDSAPVNILSDVSEVNACELKEALEQQGAVVVVTSAVGKEPTGGAAGVDEEDLRRLNLFQMPGAWIPGPYGAVLVDTGDNKVNVIKVTREMLGLGLKEAKDLVDSAPVTLIGGISRENAHYIESRYLSEGAKVKAILSGATADSQFLQPQFAAGTMIDAPANLTELNATTRFTRGTYDVVLASPGPNKAEITWVLRTMLGLSNGTTEETAGRPQTTIASGISEYDALMIKRVLENRGAMVSLSNTNQASTPATPSTQPAGRSQRVRRKNRIKE